MVDKTDEDKKGEKETAGPEFKEIAKGKLYNVKFPDKNFTWIDLRSEEQKKIQLSAKDLGGEYEKAGKFDQLILVSDEYFHGATPYQVWQETEKMKQVVAKQSGSMDVAVVSSHVVLSELPKCKTCGTPLFITGEGYNCQKCGKPTV